MTDSSASLDMDGIFYFASGVGEVYAIEPVGSSGRGYALKYASVGGHTFGMRAAVPGGARDRAVRGASRRRVVV